jgi:hypothetical protein
VLARALPTARAGPGGPLPALPRRSGAGLPRRRSVRPAGVIDHYDNVPLFLIIIASDQRLPHRPVAR